MRGSSNATKSTSGRSSSAASARLEPNAWTKMPRSRSKPSRSTASRTSSRTAAPRARRAPLVAGARPAALGLLAHALLRQPQPTVQRRPAHDLGVHEVLGLEAPLPQPVVGLLPRLGRVVDDVDDEAPMVVVR